MLEGRRRGLPKGRPDTLKTLGIVSAMLKDQKRWAEVEPLYTEELDLRRKPDGKQDALFASAASNLGTALLRLNRPKEAEPLLREALRVFQSLNEHHWQRYHQEILLAEATFQLGRLDESIRLLRSALHGLKEKLPPTQKGQAAGLSAAAERLAKVIEAVGHQSEAARKK